MGDAAPEAASFGGLGKITADMTAAWECEAYWPGASAIGAVCFFAGEDEPRYCRSAAGCHQAMTAERQWVFDRIQALAAEGDPAGAYLAGEFTSPGQLLGGGDVPTGAGDGPAPG